MKYLVMKPGETLPFEISPAALKDGFERGFIGGAWTARRDDDREGDWITVAELFAMVKPGRDSSAARVGWWRRLFGA